MKKNNLPQELEIKKTLGYEVTLMSDERNSYKAGCYGSATEADAAAKGSSWYGGNGTVNQIDNLFTDGKHLYKVELVGTQIDFAKAEKKRIAALHDSILRKLTVDELEYLNHEKLK